MGDKCALIQEMGKLFMGRSEMSRVRRSLETHYSSRSRFRGGWGKIRIKEPELNATITFPAKDFTVTEA